MLNQTGTNGILGFGANSPIWSSLVNPETNEAIYSIALARI